MCTLIMGLRPLLVVGIEKCCEAQTRLLGYIKFPYVQCALDGKRDDPN